jgi:putative transposase
VSAVVSLRANGLEARQAMFLKTIAPAWRKFEDWPVPALAAVPEKHRERFKRLCKAARLFLLAQPMGEVLTAAKVEERQFFLLMSNALSTRPDATTIQGGRAFNHCSVQSLRVREAPLQKFEVACAGFGGEFGKLLRNKPGIAHKLQRHLDGEKRPNRITPTLFHGAFLRFAEEEGVGENEYPRNTITKAKKPLWRWFNEVYLPTRVIRHIRKEHGRGAATAAAHSEGEGAGIPAHEPYSAWVLDAVKVDSRCTLALPSTRFGSQRVPMSKFQGLLLRSLAPVSLNLAWVLCLREQPSKDDVLLLLKNAIVGRPVSVGPDRRWALEEGAGFPAELLVALRYVAPRHVFLDNALAHLADDVQNFLTMIGGGEVYLGTPATPKARPEIEAAFSRYLTGFVHQLIGTTGTGPSDPLRKAAEAPPEKCVPWWLIDEASQAYFANENVTPSAGAGYLDAMTRLREMVAADSLNLIYMPPGRRKPHHFSMPEETRIKCNLAAGRLPHCYTKYRRYSSRWLKSNPQLKGKRYWIRHNADDLSRVLLMDDDDTEVDVLQAEGEWGLFAHNLQIFNVYKRYKHLGMKKRRPYEAPMHMVLKYMAEIAPNDPAAARDLAYVIAFFERVLSPEAKAQTGADQIVVPSDMTAAARATVPNARPIVSPPPLKALGSGDAQHRPPIQPSRPYAIPRRIL